MMDEDVEMMGRVQDEGYEDSLWLRRAIRWQNRCFGCAVTLLIACSVVYAVGGFYTSKSENPIVDYDAQTGEVGQDATNAKIQEALDKTKHKSGNAADAWWQQHGGESSNPFGVNSGSPNDVNDWLSRHNASHDANAWAATQARWNRTHPHSVPLPSNDNGPSVGKGNKKGRAHGKPKKGKNPNVPKGSSQGNSQSNPADYSAWLAADVTLESGTMFEVVETLPHDTTSFTEGLTFTPLEGSQGALYESTGLNGKSALKLLDPITGAVQKTVELQQQYFGEGLTYYKGKLIQITWQSKAGFVYNASDLTIPPETFEFTTTRDEGWGLTYDEASNELIVSDGSDYLHFWDPSTFKQVRKVQVTRKSGTPATNLNELEFWRGRVLANVWYEDVILVIHPQTGVVEKEYDFAALRQKYKPGNDVLNGISVTNDPNILYITGKFWSTLFRVRLLP